MRKVSGPVGKTVKMIIAAHDRCSFFKIKHDGQIRFIMMPQDKAIYVGEIQGDVLHLIKTNGPFQWCVPSELCVLDWQVLSIENRDTNETYYSDKATLVNNGRWLYEESESTRQLYVHLDRDYWHE